MSDTLHNVGSGPRRRFRYLWCRLVGHRFAPVEVSWDQREEGGQWERMVMLDPPAGCARCLFLAPFDLPLFTKGTVYIDDVKAVFV